MKRNSMTTVRSENRWYSRIAAVALALGIGVLPLAGNFALAAPSQRGPAPIVGSAIGGSRVSPAPSDQPVVAGPWSFTISEILTGDGASAKVTEASAENTGPGDGMQYVAVHLSTTNTSIKAYEIAESDFGVTGNYALVFQNDTAIAPDPALEGMVAPGVLIDGWVVSTVPADEGNLILVYDSTTIDGNWADALIALTPGATIADRGQGEAPNNLGKDISAPAAINERVVTDDWSFVVDQVLEGQDVYNLFPSSDYRTTALGDTDAQGLPYWVGIHVEITNNAAGGGAAFLSQTAFMPVMNGGNPVPDALILTPPSPDITGYSYPGGGRSGWVLFAMPVGLALDIVRFQPFGTDSDARYITLTGAAGSVLPELTFSVGETVITIEDRVNMRTEPSTDSDIVEELSAGTALEITGEKVEGSGHTWYPVKDPKTGKEGYVVVDYLGYSA
ncbi:hypothetical protein BH09CHL1_BH09CHL1_33660 [soil metagenome]